MQVFILDFGLWLKHRKPVLAPFPSSTTAALDKAGNIFLPLFPNENINQSLINLDYVGCLACKLLGEDIFSLSSGLLLVPALALGYRISTIKNNWTFPYLVSLPSWQSYPQWKYYHWLVDPLF